MSELESKSLREKLNGFQEWMSEQIDLGLLSLEQTPPCFDRERHRLRNEVREERTVGSHCRWCGKPFRFEEEKRTDNHLDFYHPEPCYVQHKNVH